MKCLVTGSNGFMGKWLLPELKKRHKVVPFDLPKSITDKKHLSKVPKVDRVFHLAGVSFLPDAAKYPSKAFEINSFGTLNVLEVCRKYDAKIIFPSTYLYGNPKYLPVDEKHPLQVKTTYAKSKFIAEELIKQYHQEYGLPYAILRFFNIYGPKQAPHFLIPRIVSQLGKKKITLMDPKPKRDFTFISDAVLAYQKAAKGKKSGTYNIGSGKSYSVKEVAEKIINLSGRKIALEFKNKRRKHEVMDCVASNKKAKKELGWSPKVKLEKGLKETIAKWR